MILDINKIAEDNDSVCYKSVCGDKPTNIFLVSKTDFSVVPIIIGDEKSMAGALAKLRRAVKAGEFPKSLTLATG